jgi:hypothetical protein
MRSLKVEREGRGRIKIAGAERRQKVGRVDRTLRVLQWGDYFPRTDTLALVEIAHLETIEAGITRQERPRRPENGAG